MSIDESEVDADLQSRMSGIDARAEDAITLIWQGFLEHARRPLDFGESFDNDRDNDLLSFLAKRGRDSTEWRVVLKRRIGVVEDDEYAGTIVAACRTTVADGPAWQGVDQFGTDAYAGSDEGVEAFRSTVEASPAFAAWRSSALREFRAVAAFG
jgi:hypothetical protein